MYYYTPPMKHLSLAFPELPSSNSIDDNLLLALDRYCRTSIPVKIISTNRRMHPKKMRRHLHVEGFQALAVSKYLPKEQDEEDLLRQGRDFATRLYKGLQTLDSLPDGGPKQSLSNGALDPRYPWFWDYGSSNHIIRSFMMKFLQQQSYLRVVLRLD